MKSAFNLSLIGLLATSAHAHYVFNHLVIEGVEAEAWQYIRDVAVEPGLNIPEDSINGKMRPQYDFNSEDMACGRDAFKSAKKTQTADVKAGSELGFNIQHDFYDNEPGGLDSIFHEGPAQIYLARAPNDDLENFNGADGRWFKIASLVAAHGTKPNPDYWVTYDKRRVNFTLPEATPPGKYLLRIDHFMMAGNQTQFYVNCAHVNIIGQGGGVIPEQYYAKFPGEYKPTDPSIDVDYHYYNQPGKWLEYVAPGPKVWDSKTVSKRGLGFYA